jgi:hypothetical protein
LFFNIHIRPCSNGGAAVIAAYSVPIATPVGVKRLFGKPAIFNIEGAKDLKLPSSSFVLSHTCTGCSNTS